MPQIIVGTLGKHVPMPTVTLDPNSFKPTSASNPGVDLNVGNIEISGSSNVIGVKITDLYVPSSVGSFGAANLNILNTFSIKGFNYKLISVSGSYIGYNADGVPIGSYPVRVVTHNPDVVTISPITQGASVYLYFVYVLV